MILKLQVPNYTEKHLIQEFKHNGMTLYADLTVYCGQFGFDDVPVYTLDENNDAEVYGYFDAEILSEFGIN